MNETNTKEDIFYMEIAQTVAKQSYCVRKKVGAVLVTKEGVISIGYNGTISKHYLNVCELENGETAPWVVHAEEAALYKLSKSNISVAGSSLYVTLAPCVQCAKMLAANNISKVFYIDPHKGNAGLEILKNCKIEVVKVER